MMFGNREIEQLSVIASDPEKIAETGILAAETLTQSKNLEDGMYTTYDFSEYEQELDTVITLMTLFDVGVNKQFLSSNIKYKTCFSKMIRVKITISKINRENQRKEKNFH